MKNNTKIRLHLSKQLFESLTKQVIMEGKSNMGGGAYTETVKVPKSKSGKIKEADMPKAPSHEETAANQVYEKMSSKEKMKKGLYKEMDGEKKVQITLDEVDDMDIHTTTGALSYDIGKWAVDNWPTLANAIKGDQGSLEDVGNAVTGLITMGVFGVGTGLAMYADDLKAAARKLKNAIKGKKDNMEEGSGEKGLSNLLAKIPDEIKAKVK